MKFTLEIDLDNADFSVSDDEAQQNGWRDGIALSRLLVKIACNLEDQREVGLYNQGLRDINGNTCGHWQIS